MKQDFGETVVHIVDDDESVRQSLSRLMRSVGFSSRAYQNAETFLDQAEAGLQGCILLDITMSHMNGLELGRQLKARRITCPIIVVSAIDDEVARHSARDLGVRFFLRKPVDDQALIDAIAWVITERDETK